MKKVTTFLHHDLFLYFVNWRTSKFSTVEFIEHNQVALSTTQHNFRKKKHWTKKTYLLFVSFAKRQQVMDFFIVNFEVAYLHCELQLKKLIDKKSSVP